MEEKVNLTYKSKRYYFLIPFTNVKLLPVWDWLGKWLSKYKLCAVEYRGVQWQMK